MSEVLGAGSRRGILRCTAAALLFGISAPAASRLTGDLGAFGLAGLLYLGAAIAVVPVLGRTQLDRQALHRGAGRLATAVVIGGAVGPVLLAAGLSHAPVATASLLLNLELVFTTILAFFVFKEHVGRRVVTGTVFVFGSGLILSWSGDADLRWGSLLIAAACLCWAVDNCVTAALDELAPSHITFAKGLIAGTVNLVIGLVLGGIADAGAVVGALVVGGFGYGASITLWVAGARDLGAARAQLVFATAPFVGAVIAWTVLAENVAPRELAALLVAAVGVAFVLHSGHEHDHRHDAVWHDHEHRHDDGHHTHVHEGIAPAVVHQHRHEHAQVVHAHPHLPDLHHKHAHT